MSLPLDLGIATVRRWHLDDADSLARHGNNREIWLNLRDRFPHPYTRAAADRFLEVQSTADPATNFAIEVEGRAVGGIGFDLGTDIERVGAEVGYWIGQEFWGRGIMSRVLAVTTPWALDQFGLERVVGLQLDWNPGSGRVLEKAGYQLEARMRRAAIKDGKVVDILSYVYLRQGSE